MKFLFKYATRGRPKWFKETLNLYYSMLSDENEYEFIISLDDDDWTMHTPEMVIFLEGKPNLTYYYGAHKSKIAAINADMENRDFDILFLISDDMIPVINNFDKIIVDLMLKHFPDLDGALHFNDGLIGKAKGGFKWDELITLSIMGKKLYDYFGYIYHPAYKSFWCDKEFTFEVNRLKKVAQSSEIIVKHDWGKNGIDDVYKNGIEAGKNDKKTFDRRKKEGFPRV